MYPSVLFGALLIVRIKLHSSWDKIATKTLGSRDLNAGKERERKRQPGRIFARGLNTFLPSIKGAVSGCAACQYEFG